MFSALFNYVFIYYGINERKSSWSEVYSTKSHDKVLIGKKKHYIGKNYTWTKLDNYKYDATGLNS